MERAKRPLCNRQPAPDKRVAAPLSTRGRLLLQPFALKVAAADVVDVEPDQVEATLARIKPQDFELIARLWSMQMLVVRLGRAQRASIARLRRLFGLTSSEKTRGVTGAATPSADNAMHAQAADDGATVEKSKPKVMDGWVSLTIRQRSIMAVLHAELKVGERCPLCERGKLYELQGPARILRILGNRCCVRTAGIASGFAAARVGTYSQRKLHPKRKGPSSKRRRDLGRHARALPNRARIT
jgi:hypothetical protein